MKYAPSQVDSEFIWIENDICQADTFWLLFCRTVSASKFPTLAVPAARLLLRLLLLFCPFHLLLTLCEPGLSWPGRHLKATLRRSKVDGIQKQNNEKYEREKRKAKIKQIKYYVRVVILRNDMNVMSNAKQTKHFGPGTCCCFWRWQPHHVNHKP